MISNSSLRSSNLWTNAYTLEISISQPAYHKIASKYEFYFVLNSYAKYAMCLHSYFYWILFQISTHMHTKYMECGKRAHKRIYASIPHLFSPDAYNEHMYHVSIKTCVYQLKQNELAIGRGNARKTWEDFLVNAHLNLNYKKSEKNLREFPCKCPYRCNMYTIIVLVILNRSFIMIIQKCETFGYFLQFKLNN